MPRKPPVSDVPPNRLQKVFAGCVGVFLALTLLKLVVPVILDYRTEHPKGFMDALVNTWPVEWGYGLVFLLILAAGLVIRFKSVAPRWILWLPAVWLGWQFVASIHTVDANLTAVVLKHFFAATVCFYLGHFALGSAKGLGPMWAVLLAAYVLMLGAAFQQRYGGLAQTRTYVEANEKTHWREVPQDQLDDLVHQGVLIRTPDGYRAHPELLKRLGKSRVFGTFGGYPNALAGAIILLFPVLVVSGWRFVAHRSHIVQGVSVGLLAYMSLACLYWSGSKAGWLIALVMGLVALLQLPLAKSVRYGLVASVLALGLAGFALRFAGYFEKGATSVGARVSCWQVALANAREHPLLGSGPGTFGPVYQMKKPPEAEMAHLAHNDYLEQATDSGIIGFLSYATLIIGSVVLLYRYRSIRDDWLLFAGWLGVGGWALQEGLEFGLYIPALAWPAFLLLGWLWAEAEARNQIDNRTPAG